jgi:selenide,water dikinase
MSELAQVLRHVLPTDDPRALVGLPTGDDAAVYLVADNKAIVVTVDFFTPIVDEPMDFGRIAVANGLSDLYAMGAEPLFGLNLVAFPRSELGTGILDRIVQGGAEKAREAGIGILGGHSIDDPEPKYGIVAVGEVDPARLVTNAGASPGDRLIVTKPLGTGIISTALKDGTAPRELVSDAIRSMAGLNREASMAMREAGVRGATDVTGYGLLGHLHTLLQQSGVAACVEAAKVPRFQGVERLVEAGRVPGGTRRNLADLGGKVWFDASVSETERILLADAQTSGGLLVAVPSAQVSAFLSRLSGPPSWFAEIGTVREGEPGHIEVR